MTDFKRGVVVEASIIGTMVKRPGAGSAQIRVDGSDFVAVVPEGAVVEHQPMGAKAEVDFDARFAEIMASPHVNQQVERLMRPLELILGTIRCPSKDSVMREVATGIIALETFPDSGSDVTHGMVSVRQNPISGYDLLLPGVTLYDLHMQLEDNPKRKKGRASDRR